MKTQFDKIYVVSLITNKERQEFITYQFNQLGLDFEFIYGIDYYNFKNIKFPDVYINTYHHKHGTPKDYGCAIGHYQAVMQAYHLGYNNVLIFEDDVCLNTDKSLWETMLNNIPNNIEFIDYDPRHWEEKFQIYLLNKVNNTNEHYIKLDNDKSLCGAAMYGIMNRDIMKLYLESQHNCLKMSDNVDHFFEYKTINNYYLPNKCLCIEQHAYNKIFINNDLSYDSGYDNMYIRSHDYNINSFFKPSIIHEYSRN